MRKFKVLMVGSDINVKGGMSTVVKNMLGFKDQSLRFDYVPTHVDGSSSRKVFYFLKSLITIASKLATGKHDVVHIHMSERGSFYRKLTVQKICMLFRKKNILHSHGAEFKEYYDQSNVIQKKVIKKSLGDANGVIVLGDNWANKIKEINNKANVKVLYNSVDVPNRIEKRINDKVLISFLAVINQRKGILDLIEASKEVILRSEKEVHFIVAGEGELLNKAKNKVISENLQTHFTFLGWIDGEKKKELLRKTNIFILPSYNEGLPLSILEAMSFSSPVVTTDVGSINEAVENDYNGFLVQPGDIDGIAKAVVKCIDPELNEYFSNNSWLRCNESFSNEKFIKDLKSIYGEIIDKRTE